MALRLQLLLVCLLSVSSDYVVATELQYLSVSHEDSVYHVDMVIRVNAPLHQVRAVLTDYENLSKLNPAIISSEVLLAPQAGVARVRTRIHECVVLICFEMVRVEDVTEDGERGLRAEIVAEQSDARSGRVDWSFDIDGGHTLVSYQAAIEPEIWIPPVIGPPLFKRKLRQHVLRTGQNLEQLATQPAL